MAAGFGGVRPYAGWLILYIKLNWNIVLRFYWDEVGGGVMKNVAVTFSVL